MNAWDQTSEFSQKILIQKAVTQKTIQGLYQNVAPIIIAIGISTIVIIIFFRTKVKIKTKEVTELKQVETRKDEFSFMITHELKTPLVPIKGYLDMLISGKIGSLTSQQIEKLKIVRSSADSLHKLIDDLFDVQKLETGNMKISREENSISDIINETIIQLKPDLDKKNIKVILELQQIRYLCDRSKISQVLLNLIRNSIDFTPSIDEQIRISLSKQDNFVKLVVEDNGSGIAKDQIESTFQKYYQADSSVRRDYGGTGLGLAIVKGIIDIHEGIINAESEQGKFTRFIILLPLN